LRAAEADLLAFPSVRRPTNVIRGLLRGLLSPSAWRSAASREDLRTPSGTANGGQGEPARLRLAYVCNMYPALSHTFVSREVLALRPRGAEISTFSIHRADPEKLLSRVDRAEFRTTHSLLPPDWIRLLRVNARLVVTAPNAYRSTLAFAVGLGKGFRGRLWQLFYFFEATLMWDACRRRGVRHIHAHVATNASDAAMLTARLGDAVDGRRGRWSWSFTIHGPIEFSNVDRFNLVAKVVHARFVVCISHYTRSQLMALTELDQWPKLHVVRCSVDADAFRPPAERHRIGPPEILCIGRLVPEKGQAVLLEALALLRDRGVPYSGIIAGGGPSADALARRARELGLTEHVSFPGPVGQDEIRSFYSAASIFCVPSFAEGLPGVIFEAMAMELPVISTHITAIPELVVQEQTGLLVTPGRADELADALERLIGDPDLRLAMGRAGREKVLREYNPEDLARRLESLFIGADG
jgi:colanic acid/amylovoran biosynthesis glycosyltransferase